jgi:ATP-dependent DNA ligase
MSARNHLLRYRQRSAEIFLYAFDLLELDGQDLRREPIETRKATLARRAGAAAGRAPRA